MAVLGIRKNAWNNLSVRNRELVRAVGATLNLGVPAEWETPTNIRWYLFSDLRYKLVEIAYFGALTANLGDVPAGYKIPMVEWFDEDGVKVGERINRKQLRSDAKNFLDAYVVWPVVIPEDESNRWQFVLDAQGTPSAMQMADHPPSNWSPVEVTV